MVGDTFVHEQWMLLGRILCSSSVLYMLVRGVVPGGRGCILVGSKGEPVFNLRCVTCLSSR